MIFVHNSEFSRHKPSEVSKSKWVRLAVEEFSVTHPQTGKTIGPAMREFIVCRPAVAILIHCPNEGKVLMSRQFRMPVMFNHVNNDAVGGWIYEAIAGLVDDGESPLKTAIREAKEEAGVEIREEQVHYVGWFYTSPGISTEKIYVFTAEVEKALPENPSGGLENENEAIVSAWMTYAEVKDLLVTERIRDFKTFTACRAIRQLD